MTVPSMRLGEGESAIFGYGSLCSLASLERTLGHAYEGPFVECAIDGWRRCWDVAMPNGTFFFDTAEGSVFPGRILYLNIRHDPGSLLNGVLFVAGPGEIDALDRREWIYDRVDVARALRGVVLEPGRAFTYVAKPEHVVHGIDGPREAAVRATYLEILEDALRRRGEDFRRHYERSTDPVPAHLVVRDRRRD